MLKPSVGLILDTSSPLIRFTMVVFPALSSPLRQTHQTQGGLGLSGPKPRTVATAMRQGYISAARW